MKHRALLAASLVLVAGSAVACGGDAPADATEKTYCDAYDSLFEDMSSMTEADDGAVVAAIKEWGRKMRETGTPENISEEAREGFEKSMDMIGQLDDKASAADFDKLDDDLSEAERKAVDAFDTYTTDTCGSPLDDLEMPAPPEIEKE